MKSIKPFLTYSQQIQHLSQNKGLIINDLSAAQDALEKISYYALIGGYKDLFYDRMTRTYKAGTTFDDILLLYNFDNALRDLVFKYIRIIEQEMRSHISYHFCEMYSNKQSEYLNPLNYYNTKHSKSSIPKLINILNYTANNDLEHEYIVYQRKRGTWDPVQVMKVMAPLEKGDNRSLTEGFAIQATIQLDSLLSKENVIKSEPMIYDVEMENRESDRKYLPKRFRYYGALHDVKSFESGKDYDELPNFVSVTILSYDPFLAGDMYYEASTRLLTHPNIVYNDGIRHIYLYCNGKPNFDTLDIPVKISPEHSKKLKEMLKYIVTGQKPSSPNTDIDAIENIVAKVKNRKEVIGKYMQQWDRELSLKRDITREVTREVKEDDALKLICFSRKHHIPEEEIRKSLVNDYDFSVSTIDELLAKADTKETKAVITK